ncbi:MAG: penicillin-binding transpeptidase domain-containing protein, partial [Actinomycetota bacterium]|nr:penicillin-binding transpeptidase domain-containing protein [Actinomycetota bacterium]
MERQIRRMGLGLLIAFVVVFGQLNYIQFFAASRIASNPANRRAVIREYSIKRGDILSLDGKVVATSERSSPGDALKFRRTYPGGELFGHITGYYSLIFGRDRIERTYHDALLGDSGVVSIQDIQDRFTNSEEAGDRIRLTVHSRLQETARAELGTQRGAVVALDPNTGEVRAMWSNPSFDPTPLASHSGAEQKRAWDALEPESPESPLLDLATSRGYPPGSTFKVVTTAAALESGRFQPDTTFEDPDQLELPQTDETLTNFTNAACTGTGSIDLFRALQISCDTTFAKIGLEIPGEVHDTAEGFAFNRSIPFDVRTEPSSYPVIGDDRLPARAFAAIGQQDVVATPLQMALVAAAVANGGDVPRPRLVREIIDNSGGIVERFSPEVLSEAMSEETAADVTAMMIAAVEAGTGTAAQIPGVAVAGKTGTAQTVEGENPHTWFICFAPADDPQLAVAVIVENGGEFGSEATGGAVAAPIAKAILEADRAIRRW